MTLQITTVLEPQGPATALELSDAQVSALGGGKRAPVRVTIGAATVRLRLGVMGGRNLIGLSQAARRELGVAIGDTVTATIELDEADREVAVPDDLQAALEARPGAVAALAALSPSRRKELVRGVVEAKRPETRVKRVAAAVDQLS